MKNHLRLVAATCVALCGGLASAPAHATTKGLSQIVTPDLQDVGTLSLSAQVEARRIGNPYQLQAEIGLTKWAEIAVFQGLSPKNEQDLGLQLGLIQKDPWLLTVGFINWSTLGGKAQPFLEGGYYTEHDKFMGGPIYVHDKTEVLLGWAHDFNPVWRFQLDYQSGDANYFTAGFTCNVTPAFQFNPALYLPNTGHARALGYIVFTYTLPVWAPAN
jgi:hypothetical protein